jgi:hypothetical protein
MKPYKRDKSFWLLVFMLLLYTILLGIVNNIIIELNCIESWR